MNGSDVILGQAAGLARITLNRPQALHALTEPMCAAICAALLRWAADPAIAAVLIDHSGGRGFCAGGDIRIITESLKGDGVAARRFFHTEYRMNHLLFVYPKPAIAVMDGVVMGGGAGLALPCRIRVATENTRFAMPETGIGLFPDVGASHYLSRLPGRMGQWLALTGARLDAAAALEAGVATHVVQVAKLAELIQFFVIPAKAGTH